MEDFLVLMILLTVIKTKLFGFLIIYFVLQFSSQLNVLHICYFQFVYYPYFYFTQYVAVNSIYQRWARDNCLALRQRQNVTELQKQQKNPNNFKDLMSLWRQRYVCRHITIINNVLAWKHGQVVKLFFFITAHKGLEFLLYYSICTVLHSVICRPSDHPVGGNTHVWGDRAETAKV